jgi:hypothetical protein
MTRGQKIEEYIYNHFRENYIGIYTRLEWEDRTGCEISFEEQYHQNCPSQIGSSEFYYKSDKSLYEQFCEIAEDWNSESNGLFKFPVLTEREFYTNVLQESSESLLLLV